MAPPNGGAILDALDLIQEVDHEWFACAFKSPIDGRALKAVLGASDRKGDMDDQPEKSTRPGITKASPSADGRLLVRFLIFTTLMPAVLFLAAGTLSWAWGWAYYGALILSTAIGRVLVLRRHPELLAERAHYREKQDAKSWDRALLRLVALYGPLVSWIVAGL